MAERKRSSGFADKVPAFPVLVSPLNVEAALGDNWRHVSEWARQHGVPQFRIGNRPCFQTTDLLAAIQQHGAPHPEEVEAPTGATEAEKIRRQLGRRKRSS